MTSSAPALPLLCLLTVLTFSAGAQDLLESRQKTEGGRSAVQPELLMLDPAVRKAVRDTLADSKPMPLKGEDGAALRGDAYGKFTRQVDDARVPSCWRPDAMKHAPPAIGPVNLGGLLALPFWGWAIVSGKCNR
ncbi:hypothetical protein [Massilia sp. 9096]|uniref:hypothetical protein n=1 Tax=Massilia sp. 9096 TaxID=1500894 RepID=UPI0012E08B1A|nr:hypothetical protein [Massilia sp. 9096]